MGGIVRIPDRAQHQPAMAAPQEPGDAEHRHERKVHERILPEQDGADQRNVAQHRDMQFRDRFHGGANIGGTDQGAEPGAEDRERKAGRHLVGEKGQRQDGKDQRHRHAGQDSQQNAQQRTAGMNGRREADDGADQHHAFDAEIEDPGLFRHQLSGRRQQQRRRGGHDAEHEADDDGLVHHAPPATLGLGPRSR